MCYGTGKYTAYGPVRASFSPGILQAGAVTGFKLNFISYIHDNT